MTKSIFSGDMWVVYNYSDANERYRNFLREGKPKFQKFLESIILHEEIYLPTSDYMSLAVILGVLGQETVAELIDSHVLHFVRIKGALAYVGNGGGIQSFSIHSQDGAPMPFHAPMDEAIEWAIGGLESNIDKKIIVPKVMNATTELALSTIYKDIRHETYMDVLESPILRNQFAIRNTDLDHLSGINPDEVRLYGGPDPDSQHQDEIVTVLKLAHSNLELRAAELAGCEDISTSSPIGHILKAKQERCDSAHGDFFQLREISGIPDLGESVLSKNVSVKRLLRLRNSRSGVQFREWFHKNCRDNPVSTGREYAKLLKELPLNQSAPARIMRFLTTVGIGVIEPSASVIAGAFDSFVLDRMLKLPSPKLFIERLEQLAKK